MSEARNFQFNTEVSYFDNFLESLKKLRDEGKLLVTDENIYSSVVDGANVGMGIAKIQGKALNHVETNSSDGVRIGVEFEKIQNFLTNISGTNELEVSYSEDGSGSRDLELYIVEEDIEFTVPTIVLDEVPDMPQKDPISCKTQVKVQPKKLNESIKHAGKILDNDSGAIKFKTDEDVLIVKATDKVNGSFNKKFRVSTSEEANELPKHDVDISFSYLNNLKKPIKRGEELTIHIQDDYPIRLDLTLDDQGDAEVIYVIAPRVDDQ